MDFPFLIFGNFCNNLQPLSQPEEEQEQEPGSPQVSLPQLYNCSCNAGNVLWAIMAGLMAAYDL